MGSLLNELYQRLFARYGPQHWWPGETPFEVMVGAILTQSCYWKNVEKAISSLKEAGLLSPAKLRGVSSEELASLIHPCGYYNIKAKKLKTLVEWLGRYCDDNIELLSNFEATTLRRELLGVFGIGEETADSILLYACRKPVFVVDAYTTRILTRLGMIEGNEKYGEVQRLFEGNLLPDAPFFNEFHALLVKLGKETCWKIPRCYECCLKAICEQSTGSI